MRETQEPAESSLSSRTLADDPIITPARLEEIQRTRWAYNAATMQAAFVIAAPASIFINNAILGLANNFRLGAAWVIVPGVFLAVAIVATPRLHAWSMRRTIAQEFRPRRDPPPWLQDPAFPTRSLVYLILLSVGLLAFNGTISIASGSPPYNGGFFGIMVGIALALAGLHWRLGDDIRCARCAYPFAECAIQCPECGCAWTIEGTLTMGKPQVSWRMVVPGMLLAAVHVLMLVLLA